MTYLPAHQAQLGAGIPVPGRTRGSRDCGPRTVSMGIDKLTEGQVVPTMVQMRKRMGTPGPVRTNVYDARDGVESYTRVKGRSPLRYVIRDRIEDVQAAVKRGRFVQLCIDYGEWNRLMPRTGDPNFTGGHSVGVCGQRTRNGKVKWLLFDPLDDARRPEISGPGPRWVPRDKLIAAAEAFAQAPGRCYAGVFFGGRRV